MSSLKKFTIKKILIPVDFSETSVFAIEHAKRLAKEFKAEIILVHVLETFSYIASFPELRPNNTSTDLTKAIENKLLQFAEEVKSHIGSDVQTMILAGRVSEQVNQAAKEVNADLIIMGTHGASGFEEFFIGSNAYKVVSTSRCPVITIQSLTSSPGYKDIVLPIDNSRHSMEKVAFALVIAKQFNSQIHLLGLLEDEDENAKRKINLRLDQAQEYYNKAQITSTRKIVQGADYAKSTMNYAYDKKADLIVIMTEQEEDLTGLILGKFAQQVVNHSRVPVMSVRPHYGHIDYPDLRGGFRPI